VAIAEPIDLHRIALLGRTSQAAGSCCTVAAWPRDTYRSAPLSSCWWDAPTSHPASRPIRAARRAATGITTPTIPTRWSARRPRQFTMPRMARGSGRRPRWTGRADGGPRAVLVTAPGGHRFATRSPLLASHRSDARRARRCRHRRSRSASRCAARSARCRGSRPASARASRCR